MDPDRLDEIRETLGLMRARLASGQGGIHSAMCRLSLPMSEDLLGEIDRLHKALGAAILAECEAMALVLSHEEHIKKLRTENSDIACIYAHGGRSTKSSDGHFRCDTCGRICDNVSTENENGN